MWTWLQEDDRHIDSIPFFFNLLKVVSNSIGQYMLFPDFDWLASFGYPTVFSACTKLTMYFMV